MYPFYQLMSTIPLVTHRYPFTKDRSEIKCMQKELQITIMSNKQLYKAHLTNRVTLMFKRIGLRFKLNDDHCSH